MFPFFSVSVDEFFSNPDEIVEYSNSLQKYPQTSGEWPGVRSDPLCDINPTLNTSILKKIFSCYFGNENVSCESSSIYFQEIQRFHEHKDDVRNRGWIHSDTNAELAGLIYLSPNIDPDSGTSLFNGVDLDSEEAIKISKESTKAKEEFYKSGVFDWLSYSKIYNQHENFFIEKTRFQNIYNRMIAYEATEFHRANNFHHEGSNNRLTLVFFISRIERTNK